MHIWLCKQYLDDCCREMIIRHNMRGEYVFVYRIDLYAYGVHVILHYQDSTIQEYFVIREPCIPWLRVQTRKYKQQFIAYYNKLWG